MTAAVLVPCSSTTNYTPFMSKLLRRCAVFDFRAGADGVQFGRGRGQRAVEDKLLLVAYFLDFDRDRVGTLELAFQQFLGKRILDRIAEQIEGVAKIETEGRLDGRNMVMVLAPDKRAKQSSEAKHMTEERSRVTTNGNAPAPAAQPAEGVPAPEFAPSGPPEAALEQAETHQ